MLKVALVLMLACGIAAADPGADLVYGAGVAIALRAPTGWVHEPDAQGFAAVYLAKGRKLGEGPSMVYAQLIDRPEHRTLDELVETTLAIVRKAAPKLVADKPVAWTCGANTRGRMVQVSHDPNDAFQTFIFFEEPGAMVVLGLIADTEAHRTAAMPRLADLCRSYRFVGPVTTPAAGRH